MHETHGVSVNEDCWLGGGTTVYIFPSYPRHVLWVTNQGTEQANQGSLHSQGVAGANCSVGPYFIQLDKVASVCGSQIEANESVDDVVQGHRKQRLSRRITFHLLKWGAIGYDI